MVLGCLLGILVPKLILGDSSSNHGINRATAMNNLIGSQSAENIKHMLTSTESEFDYMSNILFNKIDADKSG